MTLNELFTNIANALRTKTGDTNKIKAEDFPTKIENLPTGIDTSDATATADNIENGKTAYNADGKVEGTLKKSNQFSGKFPNENVTIWDSGNYGDYVSFIDKSINDTNQIIEPNSKITIAPTKSSLANALNIKPEVLKAGITILDIKGIVEEGAKIFSSKNEMNSTVGKKGEYAILAEDSYKEATQGVTTKVFFPEIVVLDTQTTINTSSASFGSWSTIDLTSTYFRIYDWSGTYVEYSSIDGLNYKLIYSQSNPFTLSTPLTIGFLPVEANSPILKFIKEPTEGGSEVVLYQYDGTKWVEVGGSKPKYTGHADVEGLKAIGWTDEDIQYFQENCIDWNEEDDENYILTEEERLGKITTKIRFYPKIEKLTTGKLSQYYNLIGLPLSDASENTSFQEKFYKDLSLKTIPKYDTSNVTNMYECFYLCINLEKIPQIDTSNVTNMNEMFTNCCNLKEIPELNTSKLQFVQSMFSNCSSLEEIPPLDISQVENTSSMFSNCATLKKVTLLNTNNVTNANSMFNNCYSIKEIPQIDTSNVTNITNMFYNCRSLKKIPQLDFSKVNTTNSAFMYNYSLKDIGGFKNLGMSYSISASANNSSYRFSLSDGNNLSHQSLMNVINNLYDIATKGCNPQGLQLGTTNLAKLSNEEKAIATAKGWTLS